MNPALLTELLRPFLAAPLPPADLSAIADYLDLLLRWNAKINLTAVRDAEHIVTRHIGESLFAAERMLGSREATGRVIDVGSGAGFPGLLLKLYAPRTRLTLIESNHKKAAFLQEAIRTMGLQGAEVFIGRAEDFTASGDLVAMRAVERFEASLAIAASLLDESSRARLGLLVGLSQLKTIKCILSELVWEEAIKIPESASRVALAGRRHVINEG